VSGNFIGDSSNNGLPDCQREPNKLRRRGHVVISKCEASILKTAAAARREKKKLDLCQQSVGKAAG